MSNLSIRSIARQVRDLNVAKRGATSLYVDVTNGSDNNTGDSWRQAFATIQEAVDTADPWTQIFVKAGTYAENVTIDKDSINLIGQSRDSVEIHPASGDALTISGDFVAATKLSLYTQAYCAVLSGEYITLDTIKLDGSEDTSENIFGIYLTTPNHTKLNNIYASTANIITAITVLGPAEYIDITNCIFNLTPASIGNVICLDNIIKSKIFNNDIGNLPAGCCGVYIDSDCHDLSIFHNNFISNTTQIHDVGGTNIGVFENFYNDHTNVDNGFGIATEPYAYSGGIDPRPIVCRNGWNSVSIIRSLLRKKIAAQTSAAATNANGTSWVDLKTITPTTSDIELYRLNMTTGGTWAGTAKYRIIIGATKVYPFGDEKDIDTGVMEDLIFPVNMQINETCKIQFRSDNAGDGTGETVTLNQLDYATVI